MAYHRDLWEFADSAEYEYKYAGKYGAKGEKRRARKKATPEIRILTVENWVF